MLKKENILGVGVTSVSKEKILEFLFDRVKQPQKKTIIVTPNPEIIMYAQKHKAYQDRLNNADIALPDASGVVLASKLKGGIITSRIPGVDFIEDVCKEAREKPIKLGFLGGRPGIAELAAERLQQRYPWINVVFTAEEWSVDGLNKTVSRMKYIVSGNIDKKARLQNTQYQIPNTTIDILFVAFGFPKQEKWIFDNIEKLPVKAAMGVGGSFDYLSGNVKRAPKPIRALGLEWLYRLIRQPWRLKRQVVLLSFLVAILRQRYTFVKKVY